MCKNFLKCSICNEPIETDQFGWDLGNNPHPLMQNDNDRCCNNCNILYVLPSRILVYQSTSKDMNRIVNKKGWLNNVKGTIEMLKQYSLSK